MKLKIGNVEILALLPGISMILFCWLFWTWVFCRFYVPPDHMAVIMSKTGKPLVQGRILAEKGEKGIRREVLGEGRYFFNPIFYSHEIYPVIQIEPGQIGVVTSKLGEDLKEGEFLANKNQKGIWRSVLAPGKYRMNPYGYHIDVYTALNIPVGYVGVVTSLSGTKTAIGKFAQIGEKGVMKDVLQPGLYYINPKEYKVNTMEVGINQVSLLGGESKVVVSQTNIETNNIVMGRTLSDQQQQNFNAPIQQQVVRVEEKRPVAKLYTKSRMGNASFMEVGSDQQENLFSVDEDSYRGKKKSFDKIQKHEIANDESKGLTPIQQLDIDQFVEFPSKDGFHIMIDMTVEFELMPANIASIYSKFGGLTDVVEKIIMPQILSISRLKGSEYKAKDFIMGEGREKFQQDLTGVLVATMRDKEIEIQSALIRHVVVPHQILVPIQQASVAIEENLTNIEKQTTAAKKAELNSEQMLIEQNKETVQQETEKIKAEIVAQTQKQVAEIEAEAKKTVADIGRQVALMEAERNRTLGKANADVTQMVGNAKSEGFNLKVSAFGSPNAFSLYEMAQDLPEDMKIQILHSGEGTLWTNFDAMKLGQLGGLKTFDKIEK